MLSFCLLLLTPHLTAVFAGNSPRQLLVLFVILDVSYLSQLRLRELALSILDHFKKILLFPQQILHLIILWVLFLTFQNLLLLIGAHNVAAGPEVRRFGASLRGYQDVSFIGLVESVAHVILMILILPLDIQFLPALVWNEATS